MIEVTPERLRKQAEEIETGIKTVNEVRKELGLEPIYENDTKEIIVNGEAYTIVVLQPYTIDDRPPTLRAIKAECVHKEDTEDGAEFLSRYCNWEVRKSKRRGLFSRLFRV